MPPRKLPKNWRLVTEMHGGTGYGDEQFEPTLYRWEEFTTGHLWWRKSREGWVQKGVFGQFETDEAIRYAIRTERMLRSRDAQRQSKRIGNGMTS